MAGKNLFNSVKLSKPRKSVFDLSHDLKFSCNIGELVPVCAVECVPGDTFNIGAEIMLRFAPLVAPVMHRFDQTVHYFFVPHRITWPGWEKFITQYSQDGEPGGGFPFINVGESNYGRLPDYFGVPTPTDNVNTEKISALPFAAYQKIYQDYYRPEALTTEQFSELGDGDVTADAGILFTLRNRAYEHDYFTSALPSPQQGAGVDIPIGGFEDTAIKVNRTGANFVVADAGGGSDSEHIPQVTASPGIGTEDLYAETSELVPQATSINDLRRAFRLQEWLEKQARAGARYIEANLVHFGVKSSDARLQRPEYITGVQTPIKISEIANTTGTDDLPQGNLAGHGIGYVNGAQSGHYFCEEHGYIIGIMSVRPKPAYQQGIPKHFLHGVDNDPYGFYFPEFANIGEQAILNKEIFAYQGFPGSENIFGYTPRYSEYKYENNRVAGDFKTSLDFWHAGRIFAAPPNLSYPFVQIDPSAVDRIFAVEDPDVQKLYVQCYNKIRAIRPMPKYGTPTF